MNKLDSICLIFIEAEVTEIVLVMREAMIEAEDFSDRGLIIEIEGDTLF